MGFFDEVFGEVKERFRDHTRDEVCAGLRELGLDAEMAERGRPEERLTDGIFSGSHGLIDIPEGLIRWINVRKVSSGEGSTTFLDYGVPDPRLEPKGPKVRIKSFRIRTYGLVGQVVDLRWEGKDFGLGIISRLHNDSQIMQPIMSSQDVKINARIDHKCWIINTETRDAPSAELWNCYQAIAQHLLAEWPQRAP